MRRTTLGLVAVAAAVMSLVGFDLLRPGAAPARLPELPRLVPPGTVASLVVTRAGVPVEFRRAEGDTWRASGQPVSAPAADLLDGLARELAPLYAFRRVEADLPAEDAGLASPGVVVSVVLTTGESFEIRIGDPTPEPGGTFAAAAGRPGTFVVSSTIADRVARLLGPVG